MQNDRRSIKKWGEGGGGKAVDKAEWLQVTSEIKSRAACQTRNSSVWILLTAQKT